MQQQFIFTMLKQKNIDKEVFKQYIKQRFGINSTSKILKKDMDEILRWMGWNEQGVNKNVK